MKRSWLFFGISAALNIALILFSRFSEGFSEYYAMNVYPVFSFATVRVMSLFPFSVMEILLIVLIPLSAVWLVLLVVRIFKQKGARLKTIFKACVRLAAAFSFVLLLYNLGCGINYQRRPFSYYSGLIVSSYTDEMLLEVINGLITELEPLSAIIATAEDGAFTMDESKLRAVSRTSMVKLGEIYPCLDTYYPNPKPVLLSRTIMSGSLICGIFSPFTFEANYNKDMPVSEKPFTICHELSHLSGFMREDEANFISFLACRESGDVDFLYSGYKTALTYAIIAYGRNVSEDEYFAMFDRIPAQVKMELALTNEYWRPFRGTVVSSAASAVNDAYLKANSQKDGTKSYGRFVDLLIADYYSRQI